MVTVKVTMRRNPLQKKPLLRSPKRLPLAELPRNESAEYEVEKIVNYCETRDKYLVKWGNYKQKTYEPIEHLYNCIDLVNEARKIQQLEPLAHVSQGLCGAIETDQLKLNRNNWVPVEKIQARLGQILRERYPRYDIRITLEYPRNQPEGDEIFLPCVINDCVGLFYRQKDQCGYIFDSDNSWFSSESLRQELAKASGKA